MLDFFTIFSKGGILLWCFKGAGLLQKEWEAFTPAVNSFIKTVLLQEKSGNKTAQFESGSLALKYKLDNEFELVFIAAFQKMLPLLYLDKLLDEIQKRFRDRFENDLKANRIFSSSLYDTFTPVFEGTLKKVETSFKKSESNKAMKTYEESSKSQKTIESMKIKNSEPQVGGSINNNVLEKSKKKNGKGQGTNSVSFSPKLRETKIINENEDTNSDELDEEMRMLNLAKKLGKKGAKSSKSPKTQKVQKQGKQNTVWDPFTFGGAGAKGQEAANLDRSNKNGITNNDGGNNHDESDPTDHQLTQFVPDSSVVGNSADLGFIENDSSEDEEEATNKAEGGGYGGIWSSLSSLVGSKPLSREDIEPAISKMQDHLIAKNVAADVAVNLCESVTNKLEGKICGTFQSIQGTVKESLNNSLMEILTPSRRVDIIRDVREAKAKGLPYVVTFCGVNGVGKSTNLAKICFWLIENKCRVLIAACDTFR